MFFNVIKCFLMFDCEFVVFEIGVGVVYNWVFLFKIIVVKIIFGFIMIFY